MRPTVMEEVRHSAQFKTLPCQSKAEAFSPLIGSESGQGSTEHRVGVFQTDTPLPENWTQNVLTGPGKGPERKLLARTSVGNIL